MTPPKYADSWRRYWADIAPGSRRLQIERAAADPLGRWLVADAATVVGDNGGDDGDENEDGDEAGYGIDPDDLRRRPDAVLAGAREGFESFVAESDLDGHRDDRFGYEVLPVHLTTVRRVRGIDPDPGVDPVADEHALVLLPDATVVEGPETAVEAGVVTYRCPRGHETSLRRPLFRDWVVETCGESGCGAPVVLDDGRTRARRVTRFSVETDGRRLPVVATGRYAAPTDDRDRLQRADRLELTGVLRPVTDSTGTVEPRLEAVHAEPV